MGGSLTGHVLVQGFFRLGYVFTEAVNQALNILVQLEDRIRPRSIRAGCWE